MSGKKSLMSMVLALLLLCGAALAEESTSGATALTNADYQQIVSTYSIDASIPGYADYLQRYEDAAYPDVTVTVDADTFVRYEDAGIAAQPRVFENYEGMAGKSVLTGEESLTEWVVDVPESGLYDLTLLYYPYAGGRALTEMLVALGARVTVASRTERSRRQAQERGAQAVETAALSGALSGKRLIFSTPPFPVLQEAELARAGREACIIDLSSPPYGVDVEAAHRLGLRAWREPGLPGRYCPESAALAIAEAFQKLRKGGNEDA